MSVDYTSALIYGFNCSDRMDKFTEEIKDELYDIGFNFIEDFYCGNFLYIGVVVSSCDCYDEARVDCLAEVEQAYEDLQALLNETPEEIRNLFPYQPSMYHLCYAT